MNGGRRLFLIALAVVLAGIIIYYGVFFRGSLPDNRWITGYNDLLLHAAAFLSLSIPLLLLWPARRVLPALFLLAGVLELIQFRLPHRNPGWDDLAAGMAGALIGTAMVAAGWFLHHRLCGRGYARGLQ